MANPASKQSVKYATSAAVAAALLGLASISSAQAQSVNFSEVSGDPAMGLDYSRAPSHSHAARKGFELASLSNPIPQQAVAFAPHRSGGLAGVAILDHDNDGDLDVYISNGPGQANSLFSNQLEESGSFHFVDVGASSGADATGQDSNGVCSGDIDNDGDEDILVLGRHEANRLLLNDGSGGFTEVVSGLEGGLTSHTSCSMGDIDGDGLLDVFIANAFDLGSQLPLLGAPWNNEANLLFVNDGGASFTDVSDTSGIRILNGLTNAPPAAATITWAVSMIDIDLDGDMDIVTADDQAAVPEDVGGGWDRGHIHVFVNDGTGQFIDEVNNTNPDSVGAWMSLDFADFDRDGALDMFGSNFGDYMGPPLGTIFPYNHLASRALFGEGDGTFDDPGVGGRPSPFSWGSAAADLDNDGDHDIVHHGGFDLVLMRTADNPGVVLVNDGDGSFESEIGGFEANYSKHSVQGVAAGDLNGDGFIDVVTASDNTIPYNLMPFQAPIQFGYREDTTAFFYPLFMPDENGLFTWRGYDLEPGKMTMEINNADSGNEAVRVRPRGSVGITPGAVHNRSGFGAVVSFKADGHHGETMMQAVTAGSSFLSQHEPYAHFGLGDGHGGYVDVMWNGGNKNRLYHLHGGDEIEFPEIACSYDTDDSFSTYHGCLTSEIGALRNAGVLSWHEALRHKTSMIIAYFHH